MERVQEGWQVKQEPMEMVSDLGIPRVAGCDADAQSLLVDSAIGHCEKLRRVLELEAWIREARDQPILARASEQWQTERERLIAELELSH
jgi:ribosomal protein S2